MLLFRFHAATGCAYQIINSKNAGYTNLWMEYNRFNDRIVLMIEPLENLPSITPTLRPGSSLRVHRLRVHRLRVGAVDPSLSVACWRLTWGNRQCGAGAAELRR